MEIDYIFRNNVLYEKKNLACIIENIYNIIYMLTTPLKKILTIKLSINFCGRIPFAIVYLSGCWI